MLHKAVSTLAFLFSNEVDITAVFHAGYPFYCIFKRSRGQKEEGTEG